MIIETLYCQDISEWRKRKKYHTMKSFSIENKWNPYVYRKRDRISMDWLIMNICKYINTFKEAKGWRTRENNSCFPGAEGRNEGLTSDLQGMLRAVEPSVWFCRDWFWCRCQNPENTCVSSRLRLETCFIKKINIDFLIMQIYRSDTIF